MNNKNYIFTSESVTEGHPDKIADQISDTILEEILKKDKKARVAVEALVTTGMVFISGEITTDTYVDIPKLVRTLIRNIGYNDSQLGFDADTCAVISSIDQQSLDIASGVNNGIDKQKLKTGELGAGDQGIMFGFATNETKTFMPAPIYYAHKLTKGLDELRKSGKASFLRPDGKAQVSVQYVDDKPVSIKNIVISTQHSEDITQIELQNFIKKELITKVLPKNMIKETILFINPAGKFISGGPQADTGLTGRKIIVDTYGGFSRHGGGAFSGKDPTKVDRSASYMARYIAKNLVASKVVNKIEIQLSYAIGISEPVSIFIEDFGTSKVPLSDIYSAIHKFFSLSPQKIIDELNLLNTKYSKLVNYGHFGREDIELSWEQVDKVSNLKAYFKI